MRIILDGNVLEQVLSGIARITMGLYRAALAERPSIDLTVVHRRDLKTMLPEGARSRQLGRVPGLPRPLPKRLWRATVLPTALRCASADVVHFPWNGQIPWLRPRALVVTTVHDVLPLVIPGYLASAADRASYLKALQRDLDRTDVLITDSHYSAGELRREFRLRSEPVVIYGAPDTAFARAGEMGAVPGSDYFVFSGGYVQRKGLDRLLDVFMALRKEGRLRSRLVLTGEPKSISSHFDAVLKEAAELGYVEQRGFVSDEELAALFRGAIAQVYPSKFEGFGLPPLEAMAAGCPVVTTRYTAIPEVCGDAALYIDPDDPRDFAQALIRLESDPALRRSLSDAGKRQAAGFSWAAAARRYLEAVDAARRP